MSIGFLNDVQRLDEGTQDDDDIAITHKMLPLCISLRIALIAENIFTNYLNEVARTEIDFPIVRAVAQQKRPND